MTTVSFPLRPGKADVEFRFTIKSARQLEEAAGTGIGMLLATGQHVRALVFLVCYGLRWQDVKMTEQRAMDLIETFLEAGGSTKDLSEACLKALNQSGVYGPSDEDQKRDEAKEDGDVPHPLTATGASDAGSIA